jgi:hypothetical protein
LRGQQTERDKNKNRNRNRTNTNKKRNKKTKKDKDERRKRKRKRKRKRRRKRRRRRGRGGGARDHPLRYTFRQGPPALVAQPESVERPHREQLARRRPADGRDDVLADDGPEQGAAEGVPHPVLAVFTARHYEVVDGVPVCGQHGRVVRLPLRVLAAGLQRLHHQVVPAGVKHVVAVGAPRDAVDGALSLRECGPDLAGAGPDLYHPVLACRGKGGAVVVPLKADDGAAVRLHLLLAVTLLGDQAEVAWWCT